MPAFCLRCLSSWFGGEGLPTYIKSQQKLQKQGVVELRHGLDSLPGAIGMFSLSLGVQRIGEILPSPVYALLSGLNASTVGIIALAAVQVWSQRDWHLSWPRKLAVNRNIVG